MVLDQNAAADAATTVDDPEAMAVSPEEFATIWNAAIDKKMQPTTVRLSSFSISGDEVKDEPTPVVSPARVFESVKGRGGNAIDAGQALGAQPGAGWMPGGDALKQYRGEEIKRDISPGVWIPSSNYESTVDAARKHLGQEASEQEVQKYAKEVLILRQKAISAKVEMGADVSLDRSVILPGHTRDGALLFQDKQGTTFKHGLDGGLTVQYRDGTGYARTPDGNGGYTDKHFGKRREDNFVVKVSADGTIERTDTAAPEPVGDVAQERSRLQEIAGKTVLIGKEHKQLLEEMKTFEERALREKLPLEEVAKTYGEMRRILEYKGNAPLTDRERVRLTLGIIQAAAEPTSNDQGVYNTCNVATIENRMYTKIPSEAAKLLADVATTGKFVSKDGTTVFLSANDLRAHGEAALNEPKGSNIRTYSSQIFQVTALNLYFVKGNESRLPPTQIRYHQVAPTGPSDNGERVRDYSTDPPSDVRKNNPGEAGWMNNIIDINGQLTGKQMRETFLLCKKDASEPLNNKATPVESVDDFKVKLKALKESGKLPATIGISISQPPNYRNDVNTTLGANGVLGGRHVLNIVDYDPVTETVRYDNQFGNGRDGTISADLMFKATSEPTCKEWMSRLELRRGRMSEKEFASNLELVMKNHIKKWHMTAGDGGHVDQADRTNGIAEFNRLLGTISPAQREVVRRNVENEWKEAGARASGGARGGERGPAVTDSRMWM